MIWKHSIASSRKTHRLDCPCLTAEFNSSTSISSKSPRSMKVNRKKKRTGFRNKPMTFILPARSSGITFSPTRKASRSGRASIGKRFRTSRVPVIVFLSRSISIHSLPQLSVRSKRSHRENLMGHGIWHTATWPQTSAVSMGAICLSISLELVMTVRRN